MLMTGFIYPVMVSWTWGGGWLGDVGDPTKVMGFHDSAGTGVVHLLGGTAGLTGTWILGPRHGMEKDPAKRKDIKKDPSYQKLAEFGSIEELEPFVLKLAYDDNWEEHSYPFIVYGTIIFSVCWMFFNGGSSGTMFPEPG